MNIDKTLLQQRLDIDRVLEERLANGAQLSEYKLPKTTNNLPYVARMGPHTGRGDSMNEARAQLAHKLGLAK